jgi:UPF0271 protein
VIQRLGDGALRVPRPPGRSESALLSAVRAWPNVVDASLTERWLAVYFAEGVAPHVDEALVVALASVDDAQSSSTTVEIAVRYDGVDLDDVARTCGVSPERVRELHETAEYTVLFLGFLPGFAYLGGLPRELHVPRLATPRTRVPKNALALAGPYAGVYPFASPGGWNLIGTALDVSLFDEVHGARLRPGDHVRFRAQR